MSETENVSDKTLLNALEEVRPLISTAAPQLLKLFELLVARAVETGQKFNEHGHPVKVSTRGNEYESPGSGFASSPAKEGSYGCHPRIEIGKSNDRKA